MPSRRPRFFSLMTSTSANGAPARLSTSQDSLGSPPQDAVMGGRKGKRAHRTSMDSEEPDANRDNHPSTASDAQPQGARKKQKRNEYLSTLQESGSIALPKKKFYRQRAHANPFSDHSLEYPVDPELMDWTTHYPSFALKDDDKISKDIQVADIGCGFGGLLFALAPTMPDTLLLGLEIRVSVTEFVANKIGAMRAQQLASSPDATAIQPTPDMPDIPAPGTVQGGYQNISVLRANTMKFLPNFFRRHQLAKIFLCFPDPHFKARKHKARIVSPTLNSEYAYALRPGGIVYTITDVEDLHLWMKGHFDNHPSFEGIDAETLAAEGDQCIAIMREETEEGKKVTRHKGRKFVACFRRLADPPWPGEAS